MLPRKMYMHNSNVYISLGLHCLDPHQEIVVTGKEDLIFTNLEDSDDVPRT